MDAATLETASQTLPPGHPGEGDASYIARRSEFTKLVGSLHPRSPPHLHLRRKPRFPTAGAR